MKVEALEANINRIVLGSNSSSSLCSLILECQLYPVCLIASFPLPDKRELKHMGFPGGAVVKNLPAVQETRGMWVQSLGWEDPLK